MGNTIKACERRQAELLWTDVRRGERTSVFSESFYNTADPHALPYLCTITLLSIPSVIDYTGYESGSYHFYIIRTPLIGFRGRVSPL